MLYYFYLKLDEHWPTTCFVRLTLQNKHVMQIMFRIPGHGPSGRLVRQELGMRPLGRSPCVPDKSSRGLGSMSRYSAQILICFIAYICLFIHLRVCLALQDCHHAQCHLPLSTVIRMRLVIRQSNLPACLAEVLAVAKLMQTLWHLCHWTGETDR